MFSYESMAMMIGNISIQACYCEGFPTLVWRHESIFSGHGYCGWIIDAPVHVATHACRDHVQMEDYNDSTHHTCTTNYGLPMLTM